MHSLRSISSISCDCEMHSSVIVSAVDEAVFRNLGVNLTCEAKHEGTKLFHK